MLNAPQRSLLRILTAASFVALIGCNEEAEFLPDADDTDTSADGGTDAPDSDTSTDVRPDVDADTRPDGPVCDGPNPADSCMDLGCPDGQTCVQVPDGCAPSSCSCDESGWACTADCGPQFACQPEAEGCPAVEPFGQSCTEEGLMCEWGSECCCGQCYASTFCQCAGGSWGCGATDACFIESCAGRECDSDTDCEGGGVATQCVAGICTAESTLGGWGPGPVIELRTDCAPAASDGFTFDDVHIDGDVLSMAVSYGGGCQQHLFRVCWDGSFMESSPVQVAFDLQHESNDDPCDAVLNSELLLPLAELRAAYEEAYRSNAGAIIIRLDEESERFDFDACTGVELPACPVACADGAFERCGEPCDAVDPPCGNEIGDGMTCVDGLWQCSIHPPLGEDCNLVCRR